MRVLEKTARSVAVGFDGLAGLFILAMMLLTCADVILRLRWFRRPIPGTYELVCFFGAMAVACAMARTTLDRGHVAVSLVVRLFPGKIQGLIGLLTDSFSIVIFAMISWQSLLYANDLRSTGEVSLTLQLPFYPFVYGVALSAAAVCLVLLIDLKINFSKATGK